ncbi:hypothetical protein DICVIV_12718 [Dictyocaulus viviparus]|uniref:Uncharacterized protein n=1 Tax=Dictyocaulus viviparus TaxID=29172 RepID=A0A0D8XC29_DICVI|nr:hypothetical protein DICVIV_12718 [Dictyocaulus viviparus]
MGTISMYYSHVFIGISSTLILSNCAKRQKLDSETNQPQKSGSATPASEHALPKTSASSTSSTDRVIRNEITAKSNPSNWNPFSKESQVTAPVLGETTMKPSISARNYEELCIIIVYSLQINKTQNTYDDAPQNKPQQRRMFVFEPISYLSSEKRQPSQDDETIHDAPSLAKINEDVGSEDQPSAKKISSQHFNYKNEMITQKYPEFSEEIHMKPNQSTNITLSKSTRKTSKDTELAKTESYKRNQQTVTNYDQFNRLQATMKENYRYQPAIIFVLRWLYILAKNMVRINTIEGNDQARFLHSNSAIDSIMFNKSYINTNVLRM